MHTLGPRGGGSLGAPYLVHFEPGSIPGSGDRETERVWTISTDFGDRIAISFSQSQPGLIFIQGG